MDKNSEGRQIQEPPRAADTLATPLVGAFTFVKWEINFWGFLLNHLTIESTRDYREKEKVREIEREKVRLRERERERVRVTEREREWEREKVRERESESERDRVREREREWEWERESESERERESKSERERESYEIFSKCYLLNFCLSHIVILNASLGLLGITLTRNRAATRFVSGAPSFY